MTIALENPLALFTLDLFQIKTNRDFVVVYLMELKSNGWPWFKPLASTSGYMLRFDPTAVQN